MKTIIKSLNKFVLKNGKAITIRHHQVPFSKVQAQINSNSFKLLSAAYITNFKEEFEFKEEFLTSLKEEFKSQLKLEKPLLKYRSSKTVLNTRTVSYQQTYLGVPVWRAGVNLRMYKDINSIVSSSSTVHLDLELPELKINDTNLNHRDNDKKLRSIESKIEDSDKEISTLLKKIARESKSKFLGIEKQQLVIYRYEENTREDDVHVGAPTHESNNHPEINIGTVSKGIKNESHRLCFEVFFKLSMPKFNEINWRIIVDVLTKDILYARAAYHNLNAMVFPDDPVRQSGDTSLNPCSSASDLDPYRTSVTLEGLTAPTGSSPQSLDGEFVTISDFEAPSITPPTEPVGDDFNYSSVTDDFSAVNAYYHLDQMFRLVEDFGFATSNYFAGTTFPIPTDHRANTTNAYHSGNDATASTNRFGFGLMNSGCPVGYATDRAPVIHEFAHACLQNNISDGVFSWCHGFGDALGVILCDPNSQATDRYLRSPFINSGAGLRRHDRDPSAGYAWGGTRDSSGTLSRRQILSTTMFRAYLCTGGDDNHGNNNVKIARRTFAARYMAFLMIGAVGSMSAVAPPSSAEDFATAVMDFDQTNIDFEGHPGGAFHKVIRWAFEKQGLYKLPGDPLNGEGAPPEVDVYINDGRDGEYEYRQNFWNTTDIWSAQIDDSSVGHQTPLVGVTNYFFVKIKNRGQNTANNVTVKSYHCRPSTGLVWPLDWQPMDTAEIVVGTLAAGAETIVGPFEWTPQTVGHECVLASVSSDEDPSNADSVNGSIPHFRLIPFDNNIAQRNVSPEMPNPDDLVDSLNDRVFWVNNPYRRKVNIELEVVLPDLLVKKGWKVKFNTINTSSFELAPRSSKEISFSLIAGASFKKGELPRNGAEININTLINNMLVGGMTYFIDPNLKIRLPELPPQKNDCYHQLDDIIECLKKDGQKILSTKVKCINIEIKLD